MTENTTTAEELAEYVTEWAPRTGRTVDLYLDGTGKPANFDRYIGGRMLGTYGLIGRSRPSKHGNRLVTVDAADLDELLDEAIEALVELVAEQGGPRNSGPQVSLRAIIKTIGQAVEA